MRSTILIHGPTASGKTKLAIALALRLDGEIINADAMQCYRDLNVLTARPDAEELAAAPHRLFGHVDASVRNSAGDWTKEATAEIARISSAGKVPIVVGGTGLYLMALTDGLSEIPAIDDHHRREARNRVATDLARAWAEVQSRDPVTAQRIEPGDRQRISRALEVLLATGHPLSHFQGKATPILPTGSWAGVALTPPRETLYARIDARVDTMIKTGALDEARALWARNLERDCPAMRAHGMPGFCDYFDGRASLQDAVERCKRDTRRYAKRQMTWIAHQFTLWPRIPSDRLDVRTRVIADLWEEVQAG